MTAQPVLYFATNVYAEVTLFPSSKRFRLILTFTVIPTHNFSSFRSGLPSRDGTGLTWESYAIAREKRPLCIQIKFLVFAENLLGNQTRRIGDAGRGAKA